jgi:hypothetical protein
MQEANRLKSLKDVLLVKSVTDKDVSGDISRVKKPPVSMTATPFAQTEAVDSESWESWQALEKRWDQIYSF